MIGRLMMVTAATLALAGCGDKDAAADSDGSASVKISIASDSDSAGAGDTAVTVTETGADKVPSEVEINLPGGIGGKVNLPAGVLNESKFDIDGVGLYPDATVGSINVNASDKGAAHGAIVRIGFAAPADAAVIADWYQQQFEARKVAVTRTGETLAGKTEDGDDFTLAVTQASAGRSKGMLTIVDAKKG